MKKIAFALGLLFVLCSPSFALAENNNSDYLIVNKATNQLAYFKQGELVSVFSVGTGRRNSYTPEGLFSIANKIKNRPYYKEKIPGGSPYNPLGDRWLGLDVPGTWGQTYGIHGNSNSNSIGKYVSAGCVRMHNEDVRELFEKVSIGTPVLITHSPKDFLEIAEEKGYVLKEKKVEKVNKSLYVLKEKKLYSLPYTFKLLDTSVSPQLVQAFEQTDDGWYRIKTWIGDTWISNDGVIEGELIKEEVQVVVNERAIMFDTPLMENRLGAVSPQTVIAFEYIGNWYHINSWLGDTWIQVGSENVE